MLSGSVDPRRPDKQQRYKQPPANNNAAPGEDLTPDYMNILDPQRKSMHSSHCRSDRFKVVKIESAEPFKRGRWECMDFLDQSYNRIFQPNSSGTRQVSSDVNINLHHSTSSAFHSELHRALSQANWGNDLDLHGSMLQLFYRQNNNIVNADDANRSPSFIQSLKKNLEQSAASQNHVLMPGMVSASLVGIKYPLELNFMIDDATRESPQVSNNSFVSHSVRHPYSFPFKGQILNQVHCCNVVHSSDVLGDSHFKQKIQNMSSEQSHFLQQNEKVNAAQNSNYSSSPHPQDQLNNETYNQNNVSMKNQPARAHNGSAVVDNGKQQTFLTDLNSYQEQVNTRHVSNITDSTSTENQRYSWELRSTVNSNEFNKLNMNTQMYGTSVCHQTASFQEQNGQHTTLNSQQVPTNKNLINNNHISVHNQQTQSTHLPHVVNVANNYSNDTHAISLPNSNRDASPPYAIKSERHVANIDCDNAISPQLSSKINNNNNETSNTINKNQYNPIKPFVSKGSTNLVGNQTVTNGHEHANIGANQYYVHQPNIQHLQYMSNVAKGGHTANTKPQENPCSGDPQVVVPSYLSGSLVFPLISNQFHVPLCPQQMSSHDHTMPKITEPKTTDPVVINKISPNDNSKVVVTHGTNSGLTQNVIPQPQNVSSCVHSFLDEQNTSGTNPIENPNKTGTENSIDTKIEALMDLVKKHLKFAVLEDVNVLKQKILMLKERVAQLEYENELLRRCDNPSVYKDNI